MFSDLIDRVAARLAIWGLKRIFGANCETDIDDEQLDLLVRESGRCSSCDAKRLIKDLRSLVLED